MQNIIMAACELGKKDTQQILNAKAKAKANIEYKNHNVSVFNKFLCL